MKKKQATCTGIPLGVQYFIWISLSTAAVLMLMVLQNYRATSRALEAEYISQATRTVEKNNQLLDAHYDSVVSLLLHYSAQAQEYLALSDTERLRTLHALEANNATLISRAYIIAPDNRIVTARQALYDVLGNENVLEAAERARQSASAVTISAPYISLMSGSTVAVAYPFRMRGGRAVVVLELNLDSLKALTDPYIIGDSQSYIILTQDQRVVFFGQATGMLPTVAYAPYPRIADAFLDLAIESEAPVDTIQHAGRRYLCVQSAYNRFGWHILALIDEQLFTQNRAQTLASSVRLMILFSLVLMVNAWLLGRRFAAPIRKLADEVNAITDIERASVRVTGHRHDAIGKLTESYNNLFGRIRQLVKDIKESERQKQQYAFQMLQHQIGPHFLYNTLLCIGHLSRQGKHDQVDRTLRSLASLLGYCMGTPNELVSLDMELQMVEKYMLIQNTRFGGAFDVTIEADEVARGCAMPKLVLQPLVENAIKHGLAPKNALYGAHAGCSLRITAVVEADALRIAVSDNGMGMPAEQLEDLRRKMADPSPAAEGEHIGLVNVCRRIRIYFGESASFSIKSRAGEGTALVIVFPIEREVSDSTRNDATFGR